MSLNVRETIEKLDDIDKDYRYMACNDLLSRMSQEGFALDNDSLRNLIRKLLVKVSDQSSEVQSLVVRCLGQLTKFSTDTLVDEIIDSLCAHLETKDGSHRDIATTGLKQVITELPSTSGLAKQIGKKLTPRIVKTAADDSVAEVQLDALDVLTEMLKKFGTHMVTDQDKIVKVLLDLFLSPRSIVRRRAIACIGVLTVTLSDKLFAELVKAVIAGIKAKGKSATLRAFVLSVSAIGRSSGTRLSKYVKEIAPLVLAYVKDDEDVESEDDEELREFCFQALESFVLRCPADVAPFVSDIVNASLVYIKHDPNYAFDEEEAGAADDEDVDDENYGDEDDVSWKVRRASAKTLIALVSSRGDILPLAYEKIVPVLIARFREREEKVQEDVFNTLTEILRQTALLAKHDASLRQRLTKAVPAIVTASARQLKRQSTKARAGAFGVLREVVSAAPSALQEHFTALVPGVASALKDIKAASDMRIAALDFVLAAAAALPATTLQPHLAALAPLVFAQSADPLASLSAVALRLISELVLAARPEAGRAGAGFDFTPLAKPAFDAVLPRLKLLDIDPAIKESSIAAMGVVLARFGDKLTEQLGVAMPVLMQRLGNEVTRLTTVQALLRIASSDVQVDIRSVLPEVYKEGALLLRKIQRPLKQATLQALDALTARFGKDVSGPALAAVLIEAAALVSDSDLFLAHLALKLAITAMRSSTASEVSPVIQDKILGKALELVSSSVLQGVALQSLIEFFGEAVTAKTASISFGALTGALDKIVASKKVDEVNQQTFGALGKVAAELAVRVPGERDAYVKRLAAAAKSGPVPAKLAALLSIGEIGSRVSTLDESAVQVVKDSLESDSEEIKGAASYALGSVAAGNLQKMLPFVLGQIQEQPKRQYLLLQSLLTIVSSPAASTAMLEPHLAVILDLLFAHCASEIESVRNVVAECLGRLTVVCSGKVLPALVSRVTDASPAARGTVVTAIKFTITEQPQAYDEDLTSVMPKFLALLKDSDLLVRRAAVRTLNAVAHRKPGIVRPHLKAALPALYDESRIKQELMKEIIVGPYKHLIDEGLDNRKAAFEVMFTLLETCLDLIDFAPFLAQLASGLGDNADIKALSQLMLEKLARLEPAAVVAALDSLVDPLQKTVTTQLKADAVAQDVERNEELIRSALRAIAALSKIPNSESSVKFTDFLANVIQKDEKVAQKFQDVQKESAAGVA